MTSEPVILYPNLGAEESTSLALSEAQQAAAVLWRSLFGPVQWIRLRRPYPFAQTGWDEGLIGSAAFNWLRDARGLVCWYSDNKAALLAEREQVTLWGPPAEVVHTVHDKAFAVQAAKELGASEFDGFCVVLDADELRDVNTAVKRIRHELDSWPVSLRNRFTLKPRFGCSGRGRVPGTPDALGSPAFRSGLARLARHGGAVLEPFVHRVLDLSAQFFIHADSRIEHLGTLRQLMSVSGSYTGHAGRLDAKGAVHADSPWDDIVVEQATKLVQQAAEQGFWGPCGVDAFVYQDPQCVERCVLRPFVEFNARFTLGIVVLGLLRRWCAGDSLGRQVTFQLDAKQPEEDDSDVVVLATIPGYQALLRFER